MLRDILTAAAGLALAAGIWHLHRRQETLMADFTALKDAHENLKAEVTAVADRFTTKVAALNDRISALELDTADNAEITALTADLTADADRLRQVGAETTPEVPGDETPASDIV